MNSAGTNSRSGVGAIGFEATARIKRSDLGVGRFVPIVSDDIDLGITLEANEANSYVAYVRRQAAESSTDAERVEETRDADAAAAQAKAAPADVGVSG